MGKNARRRKEAKEAARFLVHGPRPGAHGPAHDVAGLAGAGRVSMSRGLRKASGPMVQSEGALKVTRVDDRPFEDWRADVFYSPRPVRRMRGCLPAGAVP